MKPLSRDVNLSRQWGERHTWTHPPLVNSKNVFCFWMIVPTSSLKKKKTIRKKWRSEILKLEVSLFHSWLHPFIVVCRYFSTRSYFHLPQLIIQGQTKPTPSPTSYWLKVFVMLEPLLVWRSITSHAALVRCLSFVVVVCSSACFSSNKSAKSRHHRSQPAEG